MRCDVAMPTSLFIHTRLVSHLLTFSLRNICSSLLKDYSVSIFEVVLIWSSSSCRLNLLLLTLALLTYSFNHPTTHSLIHSVSSRWEAFPSEHRQRHRESARVGFRKGRWLFVCQIDMCVRMAVDSFSSQYLPVVVFQEFTVPQMLIPKCIPFPSTHLFS